MKAMILAAGLGTRLRPLTELRAKPALPILGRPVISLLLDLLDHHGIREVMINLHYLPESIREAVTRHPPRNIALTWSEEPEPLGTGGGLRRAAEFLASDPECVVLAGDMLLDLDLSGLVDRHRRSGRDVSLILREDPRGEDFGTIGVDDGGRVVRVGETAVGTGARESREGLFTGVRIFSQRALVEWPDVSVFEDLRDWLIPRMRRGASSGVDVGAEFVGPDESVWEPVGTPAEYLRVNLSPPELPSIGGESENWRGDVEILGPPADVILGAHAHVAAGAKLSRCVVWEDEHVPADCAGSDGVFAGGKFHACLED